MRFSNAAGQPAKLGTELGKQEAPDMGDSSLQAHDYECPRSNRLNVFIFSSFA